MPPCLTPSRRLVDQALNKRLALRPTAEEFQAIMDLFEMKAEEFMAEDWHNLPDQYKPIHCEYPYK